MFRAARAHRERVGERDLAGLVDEEVVEVAVHVLAREEPGGAGEQAHVGSRGVGDVVDDRSELVDERTRGRRRSPSSARGSRALLAAAPRPRRAGCGSPCGSVAVDPDALAERASGATIRPARRQVFPEPGGPWITRWPPVERGDDLLHLVEVVSATAARSNGSRPRIDSSAGVASVAGEQRAARAAAAPPAARWCRNGPPGNQRGGQRDVLDTRPALEHELAASRRRARSIVPPRPPVAGSTTSCRGRACAPAAGT